MPYLNRYRYYVDVKKCYLSIGRENLRYILYDPV
jgi:hypothetical protein